MGWIRKKILSTQINNFVRDEKRRNFKLIMTLLVRDEADIVKANIDYHLDHGVDFVIATDNGSIDGTVDILKDYERKGVVHLLIEKEQDFSQSIWVNRMGMIAYEKFKADAIFHCDADEFWWANSGNLKNELIIRKSMDVFGARVYNMILPDMGGSENFHDLKYSVVSPLPSNNVPEDSRKHSLFLFSHPGKVIYSTRKGYLQVNQGNHDISPVIKCSRGASLDLSIIHYPVRSREHFSRKVINGGSAYEKKIGGWQWRRWYESYMKGTLEEQYSVLTVNNDDVRRYLEDGVLADWSSQHEKICSYL
jgi:hypothetical protein